MHSKAPLAVLIGILASLASSTPQAAPSPSPQSGSSSNDPLLEGPYAGSSTIQARKQQLEGYGADAFDLAVTFLEHGDLLKADPTQNAASSSNIGGQGDSANFGMFNNNWYMIRSNCTGFQGLGPGDWAKGAQLNDDDQLAVQCQRETRTGLGAQWYAVQRSGASECNPSSIALYTKGVNTGAAYMQQHLNDGSWQSYNVAFQGSC